MRRNTSESSFLSFVLFLSLLQFFCEKGGKWSFLSRPCFLFPFFSFLWYSSVALSINRSIIQVPVTAHSVTAVIILQFYFILILSEGMIIDYSNIRTNSIQLNSILVLLSFPSIYYSSIIYGEICLAIYENSSQIISNFSFFTLELDLRIFSFWPRKSEFSSFLSSLKPLPNFFYFRENLHLFILFSLLFSSLGIFLFLAFWKIIGIVECGCCCCW